MKQSLRNAVQVFREKPVSSYREMLENHFRKSLFSVNFHAEKQFSRTLNLILRHILLHCKDGLEIEIPRATDIAKQILKRFSF